jgi:hypothetical protein
MGNGTSALRTLLARSWLLPDTSVAERAQSASKMVRMKIILLLESLDTLADVCNPGFVAVINEVVWSLDPLT